MWRSGLSLVVEVSSPFGGGGREPTATPNAPEKGKEKQPAATVVKFVEKCQVLVLIRSHPRLSSRQVCHSVMGPARQSRFLVLAAR